MRVSVGLLVLAALGCYNRAEAAATLETTQALALAPGNADALLAVDADALPDVAEADRETRQFGYYRPYYGYYRRPYYGYGYGGYGGYGGYYPGYYGFGRRYGFYG